ncbi:PREDICTED: U11/U12 small nuclear ribonucleoprotein 48 kDa protein [Fragaria vesca subsp. vesca]|uniref:U11/U12 small nuclear ribonucleoprotein 48 kDa protein n=1 Tax=Fragaria vesca subsp. vesca TaxID=101020 RepID=UPI0002C33E75|nr:PREDICTED: U11/U12 small nuclear ribonucleoprotein 48 kDa protein [Fragaria vesca subsp. vesca]XP_011466038.1 PREDICTED: U11/U12 small nuclear ribonucleoprotein 48 kDa protein [Fragaria vesca subsp. vesca]XP_011466039.1 PREDICTED: U11/U12 small nuclear ribonucleoprotein 48 kDa protein [Fragaria vesca subsp. vesca]
MNHTPAQFSNPNPNPNLFHSRPHNAHPEITAPPPPDLSTAISSLSSLIRDSARILDSLSALLPLRSQGDSDGLVSCPVNPHHRLHPHSLFSHSLRCPRPLHHLIPPLHYPKTLESTDQSQSGESFTQSGDLCLSLEHYYAEFGCNLFYRDCPGVVNSSALDGFDKTFTLPSVLSAECANFSGKEVGEMMDCDKVCSKFLPSESWAVKNEVLRWNEYPPMYSSCVLRAVLGLGVLRECDLAIWVIANSPKYGIVIDVPMGDHIVLLITLCLRAIVREALGKVNDRDSESGYYECPALVEALVWLASQLSKLYGELNGKLFAINTLKHCVLDAALGSFVFPLKQKETEFHGLEEGSLNLDAEGSCVKDEDVTKPLSTEMKGIVISKVVFVSQVAAAIAALHERFLLEEKIKGERVSQTLTRHQRVLEHDYVSRRADEERKNRSQYRPIIDHDGLPRQKSSNQETNKTKTKEELLAEERDYKRRRMSYRGKKVKRTTLQVTRDIIEEYMEEIKQAGGIGCFERAIEGQGSIPFKLPTATDFTTDDDNRTKRNSESEGGSPSRSRKQSHSRYTIDSTTSRHASAKGQGKPSHSLHREYLEDSRSLSNSRDTENYYRSPERSRSRGWSHGKSEQDHRQRTNTKHHERNWSSKYHDSRSKYVDNRSSSLSNSHQKSKLERYEKTYESHSSNSLERDTFDDRYDPLESHDRYEEDQSSSKKYDREGRYSVNEQTTEYN